MARSKHPILKAIAITAAVEGIHYAVRSHERNKAIKEQIESEQIQQQQFQRHLAISHRIKSQPINTKSQDNNFANSAKAQYLAGNKNVNIEDLANDDLLNDEDEMELVDDDDDDDSEF